MKASAVIHNEQPSHCIDMPTAGGPVTATTRFAWMSADLREVAVLAQLGEFAPTRLHDSAITGRAVPVSGAAR